MSPKSLPDNVYRELSARMAQYAERLGVPPDRCEDVVQEAWKHALEKAKDLHGEPTLAEFRSWFCEIVHNVALDMRRSLDRHSTASLEMLSVEPRDEKEAHRVEQAEENECLAVCLERLSREEPENGRLVSAHRLDGRTLGELAEETGLTANEISCRIYRAIQKMRSRAVD